MRGGRLVFLPFLWPGVVDLALDGLDRVSGVEGEGGAGARDEEEGERDLVGIHSRSRSGGGGV